jgi:hypothetical protein
MSRESVGAWALSLLRLDLTGLAFSALFFCLSLTPSLLPRDWLNGGIIGGRRPPGGSRPIGGGNTPAGGPPTGGGAPGIAQCLGCAQRSNVEGVDGGSAAKQTQGGGIRRLLNAVTVSTERSVVVAENGILPDQVGPLPQTLVTTARNSLPTIL